MTERTAVAGGVWPAGMPIPNVSDQIETIRAYLPGRCTPAAGEIVTVVRRLVAYNRVFVSVVDRNGKVYPTLLLSRFKPVVTYLTESEFADLL